MSDTIKVKVKRKKVNFKRIILVIIILYIIVFTTYLFLQQKIKNIYIVGNNYLGDNEIIDLGKLENYPSFYLTLSSDIKKNILESIYIKDVKVKKEFYNKLIIEVSERTPICIYEDKLLLDNMEYVDNIYNVTEVPLLINEIDDDVLNNFILKMQLIDKDILLKISQINYLPVEVDKERFLFYMNDGNSVYITLSKIEEINKYDEIYVKLDGKNGILYLDSGKYFEIKDGPTIDEATLEEPLSE
ncbi:MAG: FtsQ-type POTRA domain-containing protein [bacterium]|nr:FtsQ-type POTRA domain-containing protein [bacterium]